MSDIVERLRGIYTVPVDDGGGLLDGKDTFTRTFDGLPPIWGEAADEIERLRAERDDYREALVEIATDRLIEVPVASGTVYECQYCGGYAYNSDDLEHEECPILDARTVLARYEETT